MSTITLALLLVLFFLLVSPAYSQGDQTKSLALHHSTKARSYIYSLGPICRNKREKAAWSDCIELYDETIRLINSTIDPKCSPADAQTWLSAALTNLDTCKSGFEDFGITDYVLPMILSNNKNVSLLLSNALALNKEGASHDYYYKELEEFPGWLRTGDRKKWLHTAAPRPRANVVVAQDGSGNFTTVSAAVAEAAGSRSGRGRYVIYVKEGTYMEYVEIGKHLKNIMLLGDGIGKTIITGNRSVGGGSTTFKSATVIVVGDGFIGRGMTFRNTAGAGQGQAVALRSESDKSVLYECSFEGYQDTLYVHRNRQFYRECDIYGTVDFIFGNAAVVFQNCNIYLRDPPNKINTITAQGRSKPDQETGISIHNCRVTAAPGLGSVRAYLGRPWRKYSRTVFMRSYLDGLIDPAGWMPWTGDFALDTLYYGEYLNTGNGSFTANRVKWKGYRVITRAAEAANFTPARFIDANSWLPNTTLPFTSTLYSYCC